MKGSQFLVKGYDGANPFAHSQARNYPQGALVAEFFPTSVFWSRFNASHEILLGSRGSGKTVILRMMSYSSLRTLDAPRARDFVASKEFLGFYVALHLEWLASLPGADVDAGHKRGYFQFALNCRAAAALLEELRVLIGDVACETQTARPEVEIPIVEDLAEAWGLHSRREPVTIDDLLWELSLLYMHQPFWRDDARDHEPLPYLARDALLPIVEVLPRIGGLLGLDREKTTWLACIDEAEFLPQEFQECLNSFLRSEKRPLVAKIATLPTKHVTLKTLAPGIQIECGGNDFHYRSIDLPVDSADFIGLADHLCKTRLVQTPCGPSTLENFLPHDSLDGDLRARFLRAAGADGPTEDTLNKAIGASLSPRRREWIHEREASQRSVRKEIEDKFAPVYFVKRLRELDHQGNRQVGWFSGPSMVRAVADGNPRRFIEIMNKLFEEARSHTLSNRTQHKVIQAFCEGELLNAGGLPKVGRLTKEIIGAVGDSLQERVHGEATVDAGCSFRISQRLLDDSLFVEALDMGVDYVHFVVPTGRNGPDRSGPIRLSSVHAVNYWLPMRAGEPTVLQASGRRSAELFGQEDITEKRAKSVVRSLQLRLVEVNARGESVGDEHDT